LIYSSADTSDPVDRHVCTFPHIHPSSDFTTVGDIFSDATNKDRRKKRLDNNRVALYVWPVLPLGLHPPNAVETPCEGALNGRDPIISPASSSWGVTSRASASAMRRSSDGFSLATTWKRCACRGG
jgi:hypothetical protein